MGLVTAVSWFGQYEEDCVAGLWPYRAELHEPAALAGFGLTMLAAWLAFRHLKQGSLNYWPDTRSPGLKNLAAEGEVPVQIASPITLNNQSL